MKFFALLAVLLIEQARPLRPGNPVHAAYGHFAQYLRQLLDAGQYRQGVIAWIAAVAPLTLLIFAADWLLSRSSGALALLFSVGVLYLTAGFRKFSNFFTQIKNLLNSGEVAAAREPLRVWRKADCSALNSNEIARVAIELGLLSSHRHVFGPVAWFVVLGPAGALLYRMALTLRERWCESIAPAPALPDASAEFAMFAARAFEIIDWLPARLTAASFAAVGNFQDAVDCWRTQSAAWVRRTDQWREAGEADCAEGIILASGAGALGVKLGGVLHEYAGERHRPELGTGDAADADFLSSAIGLIWRVLVMWMVLIGVVTLAHSLG